MAARQHESLDRLEEEVVIVDLRFEVGRVDGQRALARVAISATAARYSSRFDRMLRVPVVSSLLFIPLRAHALARYLVEFRASRKPSRS